MPATFFVWRVRSCSCAMRRGACFVLASTGQGRCGTNGFRSLSSSPFCSPTNFSACGHRPGGRLRLPWLTFVAVLLIDGLFKHASFCKFVCPIGQFNFIASTLSPLEVQVRDHGVCDRCATKDCIRGRRASGRVSRVSAAVQPDCARARKYEWSRDSPARLRTRPLPASQSRQHGLHVLPRLRARLSRTTISA